MGDIGASERTWYFVKVSMAGLLSSNKNVGIAFLLHYSRSPDITEDEGNPK